MNYHDSQERLEKNPLRVLDSKDAKDQEIVADAPSILDYLTEDAKIIGKKSNDIWML